MNRVFKIVRDKIPDLVDEETQRRNPHFHEIDIFHPDFRRALWMAKLQEELDELKKAVDARDPDKMLEEALDLSVFLDEFKRTLPGYPSEYNRIARTKYNRNGGVSKHLVMEWDEEPANRPLAYDPDNVLGLEKK